MGEKMEAEAYLNYRPIWFDQLLTREVAGDWEEKPKFSGQSQSAAIDG